MIADSKNTIQVRWVVGFICLSRETGHVMILLLIQDIDYATNY